jgi:hypothetical protein
LNDAKDVGFRLDEVPTLGQLKTLAVWRLDAKFIEAYDAGVLQVWYLSIDIHFLLLHVEFWYTVGYENNDFIGNGKM